MSFYSLQSALFRLENDADWGSISATTDTTPSSKPARVEMMLKDIWKTTKQKVNSVFGDLHMLLNRSRVFFPLCDIYKSACGEASKQKQHKTLCSRHLARQ